MPFTLILVSAALTTLFPSLSVVNLNSAPSSLISWSDLSTLTTFNPPSVGSTVTGGVVGGSSGGVGGSSGPGFVYDPLSLLKSNLASFGIPVSPGFNSAFGLILAVNVTLIAVFGVNLLKSLTSHINS